ncbi:MAG: alpha/beta hydrolase [Proteobacteria bacterium]|nr:alpha/beta hydrolase [Pseudomonadota bacterium]
MGREKAMSHEMDLSFLDQPEILRLLFYPRKDMGISTAGDTHYLEVEKGLKIGCRFYWKDINWPSIIYFHGNGETVGDYDWVAPYFNERGMNLFVADYRGYGLSDGFPTVTSLVRDAHPVFQGFQKILEKGNFAKKVFLMGRSLGSIPATELAFHYQDQIRGLIIESGGADTVLRLFDLFDIFVDESLKEKLEAASNKTKIRQVKVPTFIIHAEYDSIIPLSEGEKLYDNSGAEKKEIFIVPGADHNDLWQVAGDEYFDRIKDFVKSNSE